MAANNPEAKLKRLKDRAEKKGLCIDKRKKWRKNKSHQRNADFIGSNTSRDTSYSSVQ